MGIGCFEDADLDRIRDAVTNAERQTSGEIVTYIVRQCEEYREAPWKGALVAALVTAAVIAAVDAFVRSWGGPHPLLWLTALLLGAFLGYLLTDRIDWLRRWAVPKDLIASRVQERAEAAFLEEEVFHTRERTGILLFLALFEHRAVVIGDEGVNSVVPTSEWEQIVDTVVRGMKGGHPVEGVVEAVQRCGALLSGGGLDPGPDDPNELDDAPRVEP